MATKTSLRFLTIALVSFALFCFSNTTKAVWTETQISNNNEKDFIIEPKRFNLKLNSGQEINKQIKVTNTSKKTGNFSIINFFLEGADLQNSSRTFLVNNSLDSEADWLEPEIKKFRLEPNQAQYVNIKIRIPDNVVGGDYYPIVLTQLDTEQESLIDKNKTNFIKQGMPCFFLLTIGEKKYNKQIKIIFFGSSKEVFSQRPIEFELGFENKSNFSAIPQYKIKIYDWKNKLVGLAPTKTINILKNSFRSEKIPWNYEKFLLGRYRAEIVIGGNEEKETIYFWVIPWRELFLGFLILVLIIYEISFFKKRLERKK